MKYLSNITLGLILCVGLVSSCKDDEAGVSSGITVDKEEITIGPEGSIEKIAVSSNASWVAGASKPWIAISPANGNGSADCTLAIDSTLENTSRTAQIRFSAEGQEAKMITVTQFGFGKQIILKEPEVDIESSERQENRHFDAMISTNVAFKIDKVEYSFAEEASMSEEEKVEMAKELSGWIEMPKDADLDVDLDRKARPRSVKVRFKWDMNVAPYTRIAKIHLVPKDAEADQLIDKDGNKIDGVTLTVTQKAAVKIEDNRAGDSLAVITMNTKVQSMMQFDTSENMQNWTYVTLWEATDEGLPEPAAIGRIRSLKFIMINLKDGETLPKEIRHLKYLESFTIQSNENSQTRTVSLGEEICELKYLKKLIVFSYGMNKLPENFIKLGGKEDTSYRGLEVLSLASNNFASLLDVTEVINQENFPKLTTLSINGCRRTDVLKDLSLIEGGKYNGREVGLHINISNGKPERAALMKLLTWDSLIELSLSYNFIEGVLPTDDEMKAALSAAGKPTAYQDADFFTEEELKADPSIYLSKLSNDTCQWLKTTDNEVTYMAQPAVKGQDIPRVLPNVRYFSINLNFLTGDMPNWILFHPYFAYWNPETLVFNQQEQGKDTEGNPVNFDNVDMVNYDYTYYYGNKKSESATANGIAYPLYYRRFVANASAD